MRRVQLTEEQHLDYVGLEQSCEKGNGHCNDTQCIQPELEPEVPCGEQPTLCDQYALIVVALGGREQHIEEQDGDEEDLQREEVGELIVPERHLEGYQQS